MYINTVEIKSKGKKEHIKFTPFDELMYGVPFFNILLRGTHISIWRLAMLEAQKGMFTIGTKVGGRSSTLQTKQKHIYTMIMDE